jgi:hypothetical protein
LHFTDTHLSFGFLELMSGHRYSRQEKAFGPGDTESDVTDPAIEHDVPRHPSFLPHLYLFRDRIEGIEMLKEFLDATGKGVGFSKAAPKSMGVGKGKSEGKGKGLGEGDGKGKFSGIPGAGGRRRSRSRSRILFAP